MTVHQLNAPAYDEVPAPDGCVGCRELVDRAGITYRQLDYWCRTGRLHPLNSAPGSGASRWFRADQVGRAAGLKALLDAGLSLVTAVDVIEELLETGSVRLTDDITIALATEL